jgi:hypothetical protein
VAALAVSLAIHGVGTALALLSGGVAIARSAATAEAIVAELVLAESTAVAAAAPARAPARGAAPAVRPSRPPAEPEAAAPPHAPSDNGPRPEDVVALEPPSPAPGADLPDPAADAPATPSEGASDATNVTDEALTALSEAEAMAADSGPVTSPGAGAGDRPDYPADRTAAAHGEEEAAPAPAAGSDLIHGPTVLPEAPRAVVEDVAARASVSMRAESEPFLTRRAVFEFLLDHPDFATHLTRALKVGRYRIWRTDEGLFLDDGWGATGRLAVLHRTAGTRVMYAKGQYEALLVPRIRGEAVVVIEYGFRAVGGGLDLVSAAITSYVTLESRALALAAKLASGAAARKADAEARKLLRSFARVSRAIDADPHAVVTRLRERPDVPSRELREFASLLGVAQP